jgi:hypothetical protein
MFLLHSYIFVHNTHRKVYTCIKSIQKSVLFYLFVAHRQKKKIFPNEKNENKTKKKNIYIYSRETTKKKKTIIPLVTLHFPKQNKI